MITLKAGFCKRFESVEEDRNVLSTLDETLPGHGGEEEEIPAEAQRTQQKEKGKLGRGYNQGEDPYIQIANTARAFLDMDLMNHAKRSLI